ncbi:3-demethylubiquinone-9 3-methyltransferase [invertebrate metagenome]|uniref:3-demethylubiquinone-9 3-methyltransferase n=1 Tax=invertebrate metagenome TaxID=1711999 RepID=A0A484H595_9ZZZZ
MTILAALRAVLSDSPQKDTSTTNRQVTLRGGTTVAESELAKFGAMAGSWWNPDGEFRPLHALNPIRIRYIRDELAAHFGRDIKARQPFCGLSLLDIGCGGGLLAEPMARLGFSVTGIDALEKNIQVAKIHAAGAGLSITYHCTTVEYLSAQGSPAFDAVLNMEVVEHVAKQSLFLSTAATLVAPGGMMVVATLNRTLQSLLLAKICAEYILRWLPIGTHDWQRFVLPSELAAGLRQGGLTVRAIKGMSYAPFADTWRLSDDRNVNYFMVATRADGLNGKASKAKTKAAVLSGEPPRLLDS